MFCLVVSLQFWICHIFQLPNWKTNTNQESSHSRHPRPIWGGKGVWGGVGGDHIEINGHPIQASRRQTLIERPWQVDFDKLKKFTLFVIIRSSLSIISMSLAHSVALEFYIHQIDGLLDRFMRWGRIGWSFLLELIWDQNEHGNGCESWGAR